MNDKYELRETADGSCTLFSKEYDQCYHATNEGAFYESLHKHVIPCFEYCKQKASLSILDICFGLGMNTLTTLWYNENFAQNKELYIYSPELDQTLLNELLTLNYPQQLQVYIPILQHLLSNGTYKGESYSIKLYIGDARAYIKEFESEFDIVYQDAFSPKMNPLLWTREYFSDISNAMKPDAILSTYSTALQVRLALMENNFYIYLEAQDGCRNFTIATRQSRIGHQTVDMSHKQKCNPHVSSLTDKDYF